jgi:signal transduction histidine kinase
MAPGDMQLLCSRAQREVQVTIAAAALRIERRLALARIPFFVALLLQHAIMGPRLPGGPPYTNLPLVLGVVFSVYVLRCVTAPPKGDGFGVLSVTLDSLAAHMALSGNVIHAPAAYPGILSLPETSGVLVATISAGLRLSLSAALWGGVMNTGGLTVLLLLDRASVGTELGNTAYSAALYFIFIGTMTMLAVILAVTTRRLVMQGANVALRASKAERGLGTVLADCHDARSVLTAARLNAELVHGTIAKSGTVPTARLSAAASRLIEDLGRVEALVLGVKHRALTDLCAAEPAVPVAVARAVGNVVSQAQLRFEAVRIDCTALAPELSALVAGGEMALHRIVMNLLVNACEGDGRTPATHVEVSVHEDAAHHRLTLTVSDDGPGISASPAGSTKPSGCGVGLRVVRGITEASGGHFAAKPNPRGGTVATVTLPAGTPMHDDTGQIHARLYPRARPTARVLQA